MPPPRPHPHFDDRGTLDWHTSWSSALAAAKAEKKLVFIEMGREQCTQCRNLVQSVVPFPQVAALLQAHFVALASDCDEPEDEVLALAEKLDDAYMLPFVIFTDSDGRFLSGSSGAVNPLSFQRSLNSLIA